MDCILIIDDHPLFLDGLNDLLTDLPQGVSIDQAADGDQAMDRVLRAPVPALCLLDLTLPPNGGFAWLAELADREINLRVAIISGSEDPGVIQRARDMGACGFIPKASHPDLILDAVAALLTGQSWWPPAVPIREAPELTERQGQVLRLLADGHPNKRMATLMGVSNDTIKSHLKLIYERLDVTSRTECLARARESGLI